MWSPFHSPSSLSSKDVSSSSKPIISTVYVNNNEKLKGLINTVLIHLPTLTSDEKLLLEKEHESELVSYQTISILSKYLKSKYEYSVYAGNRKVHDKIINYLGGTKLVFPSLMIKESEPSPELIQRRQYLLARQEGREYNKMMYKYKLCQFVCQADFECFCGKEYKNEDEEHEDNNNDTTQHQVALNPQHIYKRIKNTNSKNKLG